MFKFRRMCWDGKITCEKDICITPDELTFRLGKYVAKNDYEYIFPKISIGGYNAFVIANDYNLVYEKYNYFDTTFSDYVYIINYKINPPQNNQNIADNKTYLMRFLGFIRYIYPYR